MRKLNLKKKIKKAKDESEEMSDPGERAESESVDDEDYQEEENGGKKSRESSAKRSSKNEKNSKNSNDADGSSDAGSEEDEKHNDEVKTEKEETNAKDSKKTDNGTEKSKGKRKANKKEKTPPPKEESEDENDDEEEEYEVESLVDHKNIKGVSHFLIRWKGYGPDSDTWEPENTLSCDELIKKYKKKEKPGNQKGKRTSPAKDKKPAKKAKRNKAEDDDEDEPQDPDKEWEVEKIISVGFEKDGSRMFRIRWKGYKAKNDTWEPEKHLNCSDLIEKFMKKYDESQDVDAKELRESPKKIQPFADSFSRRASKRNPQKPRAVYYDAE